MHKNVVVCCDGTANEFTTDRANVAKLFFTFVQDPARQVAYYHPGVGTMAPPGVFTRAGAFFNLTTPEGYARGGCGTAIENGFFRLGLAEIVGFTVPANRRLVAAL